MYGEDIFGDIFVGDIFVEDKAEKRHFRWRKPHGDIFVVNPQSGQLGAQMGQLETQMG